MLAMLRRSLRAKLKDLQFGVTFRSRDTAVGASPG